MYFTLFHPNVSLSPLEPIAQLNDTYDHLSLGLLVSIRHPIWVNVNTSIEVI